MSESVDVKKKRAVLVSLVSHQGKMHLSLDDAEYQDGTPTLLKKMEHYTSKPLSEESLDGLDFDEKELADFGYHILARLYAFRKRGES